MDTPSVVMHQALFRVEAVLVFRRDALDRQQDEDVGGTELAVDHGAVADIGAEQQVGIDQRRQGMQGGARVDLVGRQQVDRTSVVRGKSVSVRVNLGGRRVIKTKKKRREE